jgi:sortase (surface protein transpeptidase)
MSEDRVGTGGQPSARPDGGSPDRQPARPRRRRLPRSRLTIAFLALGTSLMLVAVGVVVEHSMGPDAATAPSAAADTQAGNLVDGSLLTGSEQPGTPTPVVLPTATPTPSPTSTRAATPTPSATPRVTVAPSIDGSSGSEATSAPIARSAPQSPRADVPGQDTSDEPAAAPLPLAAADPDAAKAVAIRIPRLGVAQSMIPLHVQWDRSLSVPKSFSDIGWWAEGPAPAAPGAVIVGAHVSSKAGPGVFFKLREMRKGDMVEVDRSDGTTAVFQVRGRASYPRDDYPDEIVYRTSGKASVHLITCDGAFDPKIGHHQENLVVFADLVSTSPTKENPA